MLGLAFALFVVLLVSVLVTIGVWACRGRVGETVRYLVAGGEIGADEVTRH